MVEPENKTKSSLLVVYTGNGKGKTTASLGMVIRAIGYNWNVCIIQFVKGSWKYGELKGIKRLEPNVELHTVGEGFVGIIDDKKEFSEHQKAAKEGIDFAIEKINSGKYQLIILDELNVAAQLELVSKDDILRIIEVSKDKQHLVITGRDAPDYLIDEADLVTEMKEIKHPFQDGILAQKGIDW